MPYDMTGVSSQDRYTSQAKAAGSNIDAVFGDASDKEVSIDDFLQLMVAQLKNQDFMNPVDDTQYMAQLAQFTTLQQMQEMAYDTKTTMMTSLIGKTAVAARLNVNGDLKKTEGVVDKVSFVDGKFMFYIGNEGFTMDQLMQVVDKAPETGTTENNKPENPDPEEGENAQE